MKKSIALNVILTVILILTIYTYYQDKNERNQRAASNLIELVSSSSEILTTRESSSPERRNDFTYLFRNFNEIHASSMYTELETFNYFRDAEILMSYLNNKEQLTEKEQEQIDVITKDIVELNDLLETDMEIKEVNVILQEWEGPQNLMDLMSKQ